MVKLGGGERKINGIWIQTCLGLVMTIEREDSSIIMETNSRQLLVTASGKEREGGLDTCQPSIGVYEPRGEPHLYTNLPSIDDGHGQERAAACGY